MKIITLFAALLLSANASAHSSYVAKENTCAQLKARIYEEGKVLIKGPWIFSRFLYSDADACSNSEKPIVTYWKAKDGRCTLKWACERDYSHDR